MSNGKINVKFSRKWVNPLFHILNEITQDESIRHVFVYGGKSAAKTVSICQILAKELVLNSASSIALRKESTTIPTTLKKSCKLGIDSLRLGPAINPQDRRFLCKFTGEIVLKGLDDPEKAKGIESYKYLYLDELNQFEKEEFEQFNLALRGMPGQKIFASWNPVDETSWVKRQLLDHYQWEETDWSLPCPDSFVHRSADGTAILIKTTYEDNYWIVGSPCGTYGFRDEALIAQYDDLKKLNPDSYWVNVLGNWGHKKVDKPFAFAFEEKKHCDKGKIKPYNPSQVVELSFDFNVDPITCVSSQYYDNVKYFIKEFRIKNSDIYELCDQIIAKYPFALFMITGDPTGRNRSALAKGNINYYTVIKMKLKASDGQMKQNTMNSSPSDQRVLLNAMLQNCEMYFDPDECPYLIQDLKFLQVNSDGKREKDKEGEIGHLLDCLLYSLATFHKDFLKRLGLKI